MSRLVAHSCTPMHICFLLYCFYLASLNILLPCILFATGVANMLQGTVKCYANMYPHSALWWYHKLYCVLSMGIEKLVYSFFQRPGSLHSSCKWNKEHATIRYHQVLCPCMCPHSDLFHIILPTGIEKIVFSFFKCLLWTLPYLLMVTIKSNLTHIP